MPVRRKENGDEIGYFKDIRERAGPVDGMISQATTKILRREIRRREEVVPFVEFADQILGRGRRAGKNIEDVTLLYEQHRDVLGRPEMFIGINTSGMTLEEIVEEDDQIRQGKIPPRTGTRAVWTGRLVIYDNGLAAPYATRGREEDQAREVDELLSKLK